MKERIKLQYMWSKNKKIGSRFISWGTTFLEPNINLKDTPSHIAILVNERWVVESTLENGVRLVPFSWWKKHNTIVKQIPCWDNTRELKEILKVVEEHFALKYDWLGIIYFAWRVLLYILFKTKIPKENRFEHNNKYFCCEVIGKLTGENYEMTSPVTMMVNLEKSYLAYLKDLKEQQ